MASIPKIITVVVPSPTSSSCVRLNSIILFAAGCATSISRKIAWPSFVSTIPPIGSRSIFNIAFGPRHDLMMSATLPKLAAVRDRIVLAGSLRFGGRDIGYLSFPADLSFTTLRV